jgi:molybdopterin-guanine dinucleotide biosynthesis protein A
MGEDKALLPFGEADSLIQHQHQTLSTLFKDVYLSTKKDRHDTDIPIIADNYEESSPLVGILSVFEQLQEHRVFILSVDTPLIHTAIIQKILSAENKQPCTAVIAKNRGEIQPLCGLYSRDIIPLAEAAFKKNDHKLHRLLQQADACYVDFGEDVAFINLNRPQDYQRALLLHKL